MLVAALLVAAACGSDDDDVASPATTVASTATSAPAPTPPTVPPASVAPTTLSGGVVPEGFSTIAATATAADGTVCELCLWLADDDASRGRGLMRVTDLGGKDGMAFVYPEPHTTAFYMLNTVMPLSIAFFGPDGAFLGAFDMEPCATDPCPTYPTPEGFTVAVEVPQGGLDERALGAGSRLVLGAAGCDGA